jgi:hypothetical protein
MGRRAGGGRLAPQPRRAPSARQPGIDGWIGGGGSGGTPPGRGPITGVTSERIGSPGRMAARSTAKCGWPGTLRRAPGAARRDARVQRRAATLELALVEQALDHDAAVAPMAVDAFRSDERHARRATPVRAASPRAAAALSSP